jgi:hypothetical protein
MMNINFFHSFWRIVSFLFLALVCCGQVYQSTHLHHSHDNDLVVFEVSTHPLDLAVEHSSAHHHHEEKPSPQGENKHDFKKKADWNVARSKSVIKVPFEAQALFTPAYIPPFVDFGESTSWHQPPSGKTEQYVSFLIIRGPPQLV